MRVVVTGAAGLTGSEVARFLVAAGHSVVGIIRTVESRARVPEGVEVAVTDCRDRRRMDAALQGADAMVHVAGIHLGTDLASVGRLRDLSRLVVVSTAGLYSRHRASAESYRANEAAIASAHPDVVFLRPTIIYGSARDRNVHHVITFANRYGVLPLFGDGLQRIQPIHYEDLAAAVTALVRSSRAGAIDAGGATPLSLRSAGEAIFGALGCRPRFLRLPLAPALGLARALDALRGSRWAERIARTAEDRSVDNTTLIAVTGTVPRDFVTGVRQEVAAMGLAP